MASRLWSCGRAAAIVGIVLACLVGCTQGVTPVERTALPHRVAIPTPQRSRGAANWVAQCLARQVPGSRAVPFRGTQTTRHYCGVVWSADVVHDCRHVAYGAAVIAFLRRHRCGAVRRVLATVYVGGSVGGFSVNVSSVVTSFPGTPHNPFGAEYTFGQLASSRRAGGIADLLRAGHRIPGPHGRPPANARYRVVPFNTAADILYSWYRKPPAYRGGANSLKFIDQDLSFGRLT